MGFSLKLSKSKIVMQWSYEPLIRAETPAVSWTKEELSQLSVSSWEDAAAKLFSNSLVARILERAFERGLTRDQSWTGSELTAEQCASLVQAAKVFKRGVFCTLAGNTAAKYAGQSSIEFFETRTELLARIAPGDVILVDKNVYDTWEKDLPEGVIPVAVSEVGKDFDAVAHVAALIPANTTRAVVIGGGVLGDIAGFACGLKGISTVYIPTTLLAMADSSVGGKTGVNAGKWGKNQIGLFHVPDEVWIWSGWLRTLPERELRSGMVECLKHGLLSCDLDLWRGLIELAKDRHWSGVGHHLMQIVMFKAAVVEGDPVEQGERATLNLGHTMGHAVEALSLKVDGARAMTHGEAVAIGLCHALKLSKEHVGLQNADALIQQLKEAGVVPKLSVAFVRHVAEIPSYLKSDKKNKGGSVHWVLLRKFGEVARTVNGDWTMPINDPKALMLPLELFSKE